MKRIISIFIIWLGVIISLPATAQEVEVTGRVTDENEKALAGVNIIIKGTSTGTVTDIEGNFSILVDTGAVLVFSYLGYETLELPINSVEVKLKMLKKIIQLEEVVLVCEYPMLRHPTGPCGPIITRWRSYLYSGNIYHPYQLIRGRMPGLTITKSGSNPLGIFDVYQRGQHSLGNTDPLVVVDGMPGASLQTVDIQDIEAVTVLRNAAQSALYGTRGANGVIEIQSKSTVFDKKLKINYSGYASVDQVTKTPEVLDAAQFRALVNDVNSRFYNPAADFGAATDWAEAITRTGVSHAHNLAFRGGFNNTSYRLSLNYRDVNGIALHSGFNQANALLHLSQKLVNNKIRLQGNVGITHRNFTEINKDIFYYAAIFNPTAPIRNDTSSFGGYFQQPLFDYQNPVALLEQVDNQGEQTIHTANLNARWDIMNNLNAQVNFGWQQQAYERHYKDHNNPYPNDTTFILSSYNSAVNVSNKFLGTTLSYDAYVNDHDFRIKAGYQYQDWTNEHFNATAYDLMANGLRFINMNIGAQPDSIATTYKINTKLAAFFSHVNYTFKNWLFASANWRFEGANRFGTNNKWGNFYGFGAGIDIANLLDISFADQLKWRVDYGVAGNLPIDGIYAKRTYQRTGRTFNNGAFIDIYEPATNENQNLKWEERREWNVGLDVSLLNNRLFASVDLYRGKSKDIISAYTASVPPNLAPVTYANYIEFENKGLEVILDAHIINRSNFYWEFGVNYAMDRSKFTSAVTPEGKETTRIAPHAYLGVPGFCCAQPIVLEKGERLGQFVGYQFDYIENNNFVYKDLNKDGIISEADQTVIGNAFPDFTFGVKNDMRWKKWEFSIFLRGVLGHDMLNTHQYAYGFSGRLPAYNVLKTAVEGNNRQVPYAAGLSSYNVEDASFVTLENLALGYNFNSRRGYLSALKIYVAAQNLFTLSKYSGTDPDVRFKNRGGNYNVGNALVPGLDVRVGYYASRTFTLGVQAEF